MAKKDKRETVTFIQTGGLPAVLWDKDRGKPLFSFQQRIFTTDDPRIIAKLDEMGYERQKTIEHWAVVAEKILAATGFKKAEIKSTIEILTKAGLKAVPAGNPVVTPITRNIRGPATLSPVIEEAENTPPPAQNSTPDMQVETEGGTGRLDMDL